MERQGFNGPCEVCLTDDASRLPIETATHVILVERDGKREREPACARHAAAANRYRIARGIPMHAPLRAVPEPEPEHAERVH